MNGRMPNVYGEFIASFCFQSINIKELCKESVNPLVIQSTLSQGEEYINTRDLFAQNPSNPGVTSHQGTQQSPFSFTLSLFPLGSYLYANAEEKKKPSEQHFGVVSRVGTKQSILFFYVTKEISHLMFWLTVYFHQLFCHLLVIFSNMKNWEVLLLLGASLLSQPQSTRRNLIIQNRIKPPPPSWHHTPKDELGGVQIIYFIFFPFFFPFCKHLQIMCQSRYRRYKKYT